MNRRDFFIRGGAAVAGVLAAGSRCWCGVLAPSTTKPEHGTLLQIQSEDGKWITIPEVGPYCCPGYGGWSEGK